MLFNYWLLLFYISYNCKYSKVTTLVYFIIIDNSKFFDIISIKIIVAGRKLLTLS